MWFRNDYPPYICDKVAAYCYEMRIVSEAICPFAVEEKTGCTDAWLNASEDIANRYDELLNSNSININSFKKKQKDIKSDNVSEFLESVVLERKQIRRS